MNDFLFQLTFFLGEIIVLYILSRRLQSVLYSVGIIIFKKKPIVLYGLAILYFPGTLIHELSHYFMAIIMLMRPEQIHIIPQINETGACLGRVEISHHIHALDFLRKLFVGTAPFFGVLGVVWLISKWNMFPGIYWWQTIVFGYIIFACTGQMFSSSQDLIGIGYFFPLFLIIGFFWYIFPFQINKQMLDIITNNMSIFVQDIQKPILFSVMIHSILIVLIISVLRFYDTHSTSSMRYHTGKSNL